MEVAGQWRREWAGSAEYGKVTSGGVTRQVARAMEVLSASGPGARVRVMRAAYHSTSQHGAPLESFMMHSSRRVISSGSSLLQSPTFMKPLQISSEPLEISSKPLEISSMPLETTPDRFSESENYKVTEPDDSEISEPSKWRSTNGSSTRMPSEESSSADNASVIDLDSRAKHASLLRKFSFDSDSSEIQSKSYKSRASTRDSPLLDASPTLSTLKYKSLLNGISDGWNDRRKSYSFEDTSPLTETIMHKNDTLAMESSTDSGICKSTEIMDENAEERTQHRHSTQKETTYEREETFKDWLVKNRQYKEMPLKIHRDNYITEEPPQENISVQSARKGSITLPLTPDQTDDKFQYMNNHSNGDVDRKVKRVEFCKTEFHFAAESGKVNIIATDEKPPPSSDFRRRKSAFVPIKSTFDKPITLFGDRINDYPQVNEIEINETCDTSESDETTTTKSILKNKIPKPKPYLLGENMTLGQDFQPDSQGLKKGLMVPTAVSLINKQLQPEEISYKQKEDTNTTKSTSMSRTVRNGSSFDTDEDTSNIDKKFQRLNINRNSFRGRKQIDEVIEENNTNSIKQKLKSLQTSPILQRNPKARQLRESELTYFGINNDQKKSTENGPTQPNQHKEVIHPMQNKTTDDLRSVKLIQRVSNSVCNSEAESDDTPEYQNLGLFTGSKSNFAPVPTPRTRTNVPTNYQYNTLEKPFKQKVHIIKPIVAQSYEVSAANRTDQETRRSRHRIQDTSSTTAKSRSISEPPKYRQRELMSVQADKVQDYNEKKQDVVSTSRPRNNSVFIEQNSPKIPSKRHTKTSEEIPLYVNIDDDNFEKPQSLKKKSEKKAITMNSAQRKSFSEKTGAAIKPIPIRENGVESNTDSLNLKTKKHPIDKHREIHKKDVEKPQKTRTSRQKESKRNEVTSSCNTPYEVIPINDKISTEERESKYRTRSSQRHSTKESTRSTKTEEEKFDSYANQSNTEKTIQSDAKHEQKSNSNRRDRSASRDKCVQRAENVRVSTTSHKKSKKRYNAESESTADKHSRGDYVINYDDKDGTVSSICKVKSGPSKRKIVHPEKIIEIKPKSKTADKKDKKSLLQYHDHWVHSGMNYGDTKTKRKVLMQRNCTIL